MKLRHLYLALCVANAILGYALFTPWLVDHGLDIPLFVDEMFATRIATLSAVDVLASVAVLFLFVGFEGRRLGIDRLWLPVLATLGFGVSCGFSLFLYMRQLKLDQTNVVAD